MKFSIKLQQPVIELKVYSESSPDAKKAEITVGFIRYSKTEAEGIIKQLQTEQEQLNEESLVLKSTSLIKQNIVYIKNAEIDIYNDTYDFLGTVKILDTRKEEKKEFTKDGDSLLLWGDAKECLSALIDQFLDSYPWSGPLFQAFMNSLINMTVREESKVKN